jgi:tRNA nucleotidyltransferase/poly(A) polymerase
MLPPMLRTVADILKRRRVQGWLVGGSIRDRVLGLSSPDVDLVVAEDAALIAQDTARALGRPWFTLSERHAAHRVMGPLGHVDVAALRGGHIHEDLALRDFTVNAMALPLTEETAAAWMAGADLAGQGLIDPYDGLSHLRARRLVAVSPRVFQDDPLRLLRAARFCHVLGLEVDPGLEAALRAQATLLARVAPERVAAEIVLTLGGGRAGGAVRLWEGLGLWQTLMPEGEGRGLSPGSVAALLDGLEAILASVTDLFPEAAPVLAARLARPVDGMVTRPVGLRLAGLTSGLGRKTSAQVGRRFRFSERVVSLLETAGGAVALEGGSLPAPVDLARPGREAVLYLWRAAPWEPEVILLAAAASRAAQQGSAAEAGLAQRGEGDDWRAARSLMALWAHRAAGAARSLPIEGRTLMRELGLAQGPELGSILRELRLAWEAGEVTDGEQALALARRWALS